MIHSIFSLRKIYFVLLTGDLNAPGNSGACEVRFATPRDVPLMAKMFRTENIYERRLRRGFKAVICIKDDTVVHMEWFCSGPYYIWDARITFDPGRCGYYLFDLYTRPDYRRSGIWRRAVREILKSLQSESREVSIFSAIDSRNTPAMKAHLKGGFTSMGLLEFRQICGLRKWTFSRDDGLSDRERGIAGLSTARLAYDGNLLRLASRHKGVFF